jgi:hypothetical protein
MSDRHAMAILAHVDGRTVLEWDGDDDVTCEVSKGVMVILVAQQNALLALQDALKRNGDGASGFYDGGGYIDVELTAEEVAALREVDLIAGQDDSRD